MTDTAAPAASAAAPAAPAAPAAAPAAPAADATLLGGAAVAPDAGATLLGGAVAPAAPVDEAKPAGAPKPGEPVKYDLKLPKDSLFDAAAIEGIAAFARELDLSPEAAQKLVERDSRMLDSFAAHIEQQFAEEHKERVANWKKEVKESKDLGGEKYAETEFYAGKAVRMFATPELKAALNETGFGNHPELVRLFVKIGKSLSEDSFTTKGAEPRPKTDLAKTLFPTMN